MPLVFEPEEGAPSSVAGRGDGGGLLWREERSHVVWTVVGVCWLASIYPRISSDEAKPDPG